MSTYSSWKSSLSRLSKNEIVDRCGAENWLQVAENFGNKSISDIIAALSEMFPSEPDANQELAEAIYAELLQG